MIYRGGFMEIIICLLPGMIAAFFHCSLNKNLNMKNILISAACYVLCINLIIRSGLFIIGMRHFSLYEMSGHFKLNWFILGVALAVIIVIAFYNLRRISLKICVDILKRVTPIVILFIITYAIFTPSSLFLENIDEFSIGYISIAPVILCVAAALCVLMLVVALLFTNGQNTKYYIAFIFAFSIGIYIQGNFLNPHFPSLDGTEIDWSLYAAEGIRSAVCWAACLVSCIAAVIIFKQKAEKIMRYVSYFLSAVQLISLVVMVITMRLPENFRYGFSVDGEFTIGNGDNVVVFIIDTLQSSVLEEYLASDDYPAGVLDDFTCYDNAVAGGGAYSDSSAVASYRR